MFTLWHQFSSSNLGRQAHKHHTVERSRCASWDDDRGDRGDDEDHLLDNDGDYDREDNNQYQHVNISNSAVVYLKRQTQQAASTP